MQFKIFPKFEGEILIKGIQYLLCSSVPTFRPLQKRGHRLNDTQPQRVTATYAVDNSLTLSVTPPMPLLDVVFHSFPATMLSGQVIKAFLQITNKGNRGLINLFLKLSHASFFSLGTVEMMDSNAYS